MNASPLTYNQLLKEIDLEIPAAETRIDLPEMKEFVIREDFIIPIHLLLQKFFGEDFKSPNEKATLNDRKRAARWGGIREYQTLYYADTEGFHNCAMLWPWRDGTRCTVKIVRWND